MIFSHRKTGLERVGAWLETNAAFSELFRVHAVENVGVVSDDRLSTLAYDRIGKVGRPVATVVLEGHARIEAFGRSAWLGAGEVSIVESKSALLMRQSRAGERYRALAIEWDASAAGPRPQGFAVVRATAPVVRDAEALFSALASREGEDPAREDCLLRTITHVGAGLGVTLVLRSEAVAPPTKELSSALDELLSDMRDRPMIVDLHARLGVSERTVNRMVQDFNTRFGFNASTWQDARSRRRVLLSAALLTAEGVTASEVADAMGYGSLPSLSRALKLAGMPSPRDVPSFVAALLAKE
ncbi:MAG: helix-turn-helix domain-containing protein [Polyangiaceae bacterium]